MDAPAVATIRARFPEFAGKEDAEIEAAASAALEISAVSEDATLFLAAHLLALAAERTGDPDGGSGEVMTETTGGRSVSYATMAASAGAQVWWMTTPYGRTAWMLQAAAPSYVIAAVTG